MKSSCVSIGVVLRWAEKRLKSICREKLEEKKENEVEGPHCVVLSTFKVLYSVHSVQCAVRECLMCAVRIV